MSTTPYGIETLPGTKRDPGIPTPLTPLTRLPRGIKKTMLNLMRVFDKPPFSQAHLKEVLQHSFVNFDKLFADQYTLRSSITKAVDLGHGIEIAVGRSSQKPLKLVPDFATWGILFNEYCNGVRYVEGGV
jgi:hypothetical protein